MTEETRGPSETNHFDPFKCIRQPRSKLPRRPSDRGFFTMITGFDDVSPTVKPSGSSSAFLSVAEGIEFPTERCNNSSMEPSISNVDEIHHAETEAFDRNTPCDSFIKENSANYRSNCAHSFFPTRRLPFTPEMNGSEKTWLEPGNVVWAKVDSNPWWPAEVMDRKGTLQLITNQTDDKLVLIRLYGSYEYAWIDPVRGLSQFSYCYEERSSNPLKTFQDALQQALRTKEKPSSSEHSDKRDVSCSSQTAGDCTYGGRGQRKHKPKVHFDELATPEKSIRKVRRMRIMRHLGLTAPVGSPFIQPRGKHKS